MNMIGVGVQLIGFMVMLMIGIMFYSYGVFCFSMDMNGVGGGFLGLFRMNGNYYY